MIADLSARLAELVAERTGIVLGRERRESITQLCLRRGEELRLPGPEAYFQLLARESTDGAETTALLSAITNGETSFYRDPRQFAAIEALLNERARSGAPMLHLWSAACATGEEAYSLAIAAASASAMALVLGTDINPGFLLNAQEARYSERALRNLPPERRAQYVVETGGFREPAPVVRSRVKFERYNLLDRTIPGSGRPDGLWDVILCRNVFIYFERKTVEAVVRRLVRRLSPSGYLFIGAAESLHGLDVEAVAENVHGLWAYRAPRAGEVQAAVPIPAPVPPPDDRAPAPDRRTHAEPSAVEHRLPPERLTGFRAVRTWLQGAAAAEAMRKLDTLLEHVPDQVWAQLYRAYLGLLAGDPGTALEGFERARGMDPLLPEVHYCLALAYRRLGDRVQFAEALRRTVFLAPRFWPALLLQAGLYREAGRNDLALGSYRRILEIIGNRKGDRGSLELDLPDLEDVALYREEVMALCRRSVAELDPEIRSGGRGGSRRRS